MKKKNILKLEIALLLGTLSLTNTSCQKHISEIYTEDDEKINYQTLENSNLIVLENQENNRLEYYLASKVIDEQDKRFTTYDYYDIITGKNIYYEFYEENRLNDNSENKNLIEEIKIEDYIKNNYTSKENYSENEINRLIQDLKKYYYNPEKYKTKIKNITKKM